MMIPVIGIVQISFYAHADRYTYLPHIGLYLSLTWMAADLCAGWRLRRVVLGCCSAIILAALIFCARTQTTYWRNSESLWRHTLACTSDNAIAFNYLGLVLLQEGRPEEAMTNFQNALQIQPYYATAQYNLGTALVQQGLLDEAISHFQKALEMKPDYADADNNLGNAFLQKGNVDDAISHLQQALQLKPNYAEAQYNLGNALLQKNNVGEAIAHYQQALQIKPDYAKALNNLALVLAASPQASLRNGNEAVELAQRANQLANNGNPTFLLTLSIAYAEVKRFPEAVETARRALPLAESQSSTGLANSIRSQLKLYQEGIPFH